MNSSNNKLTVGICNLCQGLVQVDILWSGSQQQTPVCSKCEAVEASSAAPIGKPLPVLAMIPKYGVPQNMSGGQR